MMRLNECNDEGSSHTKTDKRLMMMKGAECRVLKRTNSEPIQRLVARVSQDRLYTFCRNIRLPTDPVSE